MGTIVLYDLFDDFILAGRFPIGFCTSSDVANAFAAWRPDLARLMSGKRAAKLMANHPWIDRMIVSGRFERQHRYEYEINRNQIPVMKAILEERREALPI